MAPSDCPFCRIVAGDDPDAVELHRDDHVVAFGPLRPAAPGHTLIVPRAHVPDVWALDPATASHLTAATLRLAAALRRALRPEGLNVIQSNGAVASQSVPHLHVHLVPRWAGDAMGRIWPEGSPVAPAEQAAAWDAVRLACREAEG